MTTRRSILTAGLAAMAVLALPSGAAVAGMKTPPGAGGPFVHNGALVPPSAEGARFASRPRARTSALSGRGFGGPTSRRELLALNATARKVTLLLVDWSGGCDDGDVFSDTTEMPDTRLRRGTFSKRRTRRIEQPDGGVLKYVDSVNGRVTNKSARGTFRTVVTYTYPWGEQAWRCGTGAVRFTVPRAYAGATAFGTPAVLGVSADRTRVESLMSWFASTCANPSKVFFFGNVQPLDGGQVDAQGAFTGTARVHVSQPPYEIDIESAVSGVLAPRRAEGKRTGHAEVRDSSTGDVDTCHGETAFATVR